MKLLADENIDAEIVVFFRDEGHDVLWMVEHAPGTDDRGVLALANDTRRILVTFDRDFGELVFRLGYPSHGIVLLRLSQMGPGEFVSFLRGVWPSVVAAAAGYFIVVSEDRVRKRPMPKAAE